MRTFDQVLKYAASAVDAVRSAGGVYPVTVQQLGDCDHVIDGMEPDKLHNEEELLSFGRRMDGIAPPVSRWGLSFATT